MSLRACIRKHKGVNFDALMATAAAYPAGTEHARLLRATDEIIGHFRNERTDILAQVYAQAKQPLPAKVEAKPAATKKLSSMTLAELEAEQERIASELEYAEPNSPEKRKLEQQRSRVDDQMLVLEIKQDAQAGTKLTDKQAAAEAQVSDDEYIEPARFGDGEVGVITNEDTTPFSQDSSNGTAETVPALKTALQTAATGEDLLRAVLRKGTYMEKAIARILQEVGVGKLTVLYEDRIKRDADGRRVLGQHFDGEVRIFKGGENNRVILHEIYHGVTVAQLERARQALKQSDKTRQGLIAANPELEAYIHGYQRLSTLMEETNAKVGTTFKDVLEFVAEAMSDAELQYSLMHTRSEMTALSPSLWQRVTNTIADMFRAVFAHLKETRNISPGDFDASLFARIMESTALVSAEGYAGKPFNRVISNAVSNAMGMPGHPDPMRPQPNFRNAVDAIADGNWQLKAKESARWLGAKLRDVVETVMTQRGLSMAHPAFRAIKERTSVMVADKENILTAMNETMQQFLAENKSTKAAEMMGDMLRSSTLLHTGEMSEDLAKKIVEAAHEHMRPGGKKMFTPHPETGQPVLAQHVRDLGVMLTKKDFHDGVSIDNEGTRVKLAAGEDFDKAYEGYKSAMETLILGHLYQLQGAQERATAMTAREEIKLLKDYAPDATSALTALRKVYDDAYRKMSTIDVKKRRVMQKENTTDATLELIAETLHGMLRNKALAPEIAKVLTTLGISEADMEKHLTPLRAEITKLPEKKRSAAVNAVRDQIIGGAEPSKLVESEALSVMQSLLTMYVPLRRYGKYMMHLRLVDAKGANVVGTVMQPQIKQDGTTEYVEKESDLVLDLWQHDNLTALQEAHKTLNEQLASEDYVDVKVGDAVVKAKLAWDLPTRVNEFRTATQRIRPSEFFNFAETIGIQLDPKQRAKVVKASTNADAAARARSLERRGIPGYSVDFVRAISDHSGSVASLVAIRRHEEILQELVSNPDHWQWTTEDQVRLDAAKKALDAAPEGAAKTHAQHQYDQLAMDYQQVNTSTFRDPRIADIRHQAQLLLDYVLGSDQMEEKSSFVNKMRAVTTIMQLGGTLASPFTNLTSLPLHAFSYLATYNPNRAFGGGFGGAAASSALWAAAKAMGPLLKKSAAQITGDVFIPELEFRRLEGLAKASPSQSYGGYSVAHWEYLRKASAEGILAAQRYNELLAQRKHSQFSPRVAKLTSQYMSIFAATEEYNRMVTGLAAFDLFYKQATEAGLGKEAASKQAYEQARKAVFATQGEYNMTNRPQLFRNDLGSLVFLYKTFIVTTLELLRNLPPKGRAMFLGSLYAMSGAGGIPLWEELMLVMDITAQKTGLGLGVTKGNAERAFAAYMKDMGQSLGWERLDEVALRGVLDTYLGTEIFGRAGVTVGIPGIGMLKPGANFLEEVGRTLGAAGGAVEGGVKAAGELTRGDVAGALRAVPVTGVKNFADAFTYAKYDAVMNKRGQVVTTNPGTFDVFARTLGFYPEEMKWVGDQVRREEYTRAFAKELKGAFIEQYRNADVLHDSERKQELLAMVREHNQTFRGTALEIPHFAENAARAGKEAKLPLQKRAQAALPKLQQLDSALRD